MHILLIHQAFAAIDEPGGTRHHELSLELARAGHRVTVITSPVSYLTGTPPDPESDPKPVRKPAPHKGVRILYAYTYPALHRSFVHRVFSFLSFMLSSFLLGLRVDQVDLIWGTSPPIFQGGTAWLLARLKRVPFLFEVRDLWPAFAVAVGVLTDPTLIRLAEWFEKFLYRHADRVIVNSPGFIEHVRENGADRVYLVPNGVDPEMFDPASRGETFRKHHGLGDQFIVLYAGAHGMSNDLGVVLDAAARLKDLPRVHFVLVGDGKEKSELVTQARFLGLDNIRFLPPIPKKEMGGVLSAADACLGILKPIPLYATVFPNKIFDYMAAGRPILLAMEGVIKKVVEDAGAGIPIPPGDPEALENAIRNLVRKGNQGEKMGAAGRAYVELHFNRKQIAAELAEIMADLVKR